ncbi:hypothetical protein [Candidatus Methylomirabilis limnetica]|uniref:hypothetical protein n=1 Tax=Candidatus Methylomirabilis limnetica TaxID=2033718 RepID=UPI00105747D6|nr:hypothetical protein [Candidatus Methylomirabilis limnetica]
MAAGENGTSLPSLGLAPAASGAAGAACLCQGRRGRPLAGEDARPVGAEMADAVIPIVQRAYDFAVALYGYVNRFPRMHKPLLGRELMGLTILN